MTDLEAANRILRLRASPLTGMIPSTHLDAEIFAAVKAWDEADRAEWPDDPEMATRWSERIDETRREFLALVARARMADHQPLHAAVDMIVPGHDLSYPSIDSRGVARVRVELPAGLRLEVTWECLEDDQPTVRGYVLRDRADELTSGTPEEVRLWVVRLLADWDRAVQG